MSILPLVTLLLLADIRFPMRTESVLPEPSPEAVQVRVDTLRPDEWYVVESSEPLIVLASPEGIAGVESLAGPMTFRGKFPGGTKYETRTFAGPYLFAVTAETPGKCELIVIEPVSREVIRQTLTVTGEAPRPPPGPEPEPPGPEPTPQPAIKHAQLVIVIDAENLPPDAAIVLNALVGWNSFLDAGNEYRVYDKDDPAPQAQLTGKALGDDVPGICILNKENGVEHYRGKLPKTFADLKTLVGRYVSGH